VFEGRSYAIILSLLSVVTTQQTTVSIQLIVITAVR